MEESLSLDQFSIIKNIGSGAFGEVFKVRHKKTGIIYAAKISINKITPDKTNESTLLNLTREVNIISKLNHPSVLRFIYFDKYNFSNKPKPVIITEYVSNGSLEDFIRLSWQSLSDDRFDDTRKLIIIYGIASGMLYLHEHNIIHRDLKSGNILLDDYLNPKIADFGLSKIESINGQSEADQSTSGLKGTPCYMSPEIWQRCEYSKSSDVYAFGVILYELLTSERPFKNETFYTIFKKVIEGYRPEFTSPIPDSYRKLIENCWSQEPSERPTFEDIVERLKTDRGFITELVEEDDFISYIEYIESYEVTYEANKGNISIEEFNKNQTKAFKRTSLKNDGKVSLLTDEKPPSTFISLEDFINLDDECKSQLQEAESDIEKQFIVAMSFINGLDKFPVNVALGIKYLKSSAKGGNKEAVVYFIKMLIKGDVIPQDIEKAEKYLNKRINKEEESRYFYLSGMIQKKQMKYEIARSQFEEGIDKGNCECMFEYGKLFLKGKGCQADKSEATKYFKMAAEKGSLNGEFKYGLILLVNGDKEEAMEHIKQAADKGHTKAMLLYSDMLEDDENNKEESIKYVKQAASKGDIEGMLKYGRILKDGIGVPIDYNLSLRYLKRAADKGQIEAKYLYGKMVKEGLGTSSDARKGAKYIKSAADKGNADAMNEYGLMLANGDGVAVDYRESCRYLRNAIEKGQVKAMSNYGHMLILGFGVPADYKEACKYFKQAADLGDTEAMVSYGHCLSSGQGVEVNKEEALQYFKKAADLGNDEGMFYYAYFLLNGIGCETNLEESACYMKRATEKGNIEAMHYYAEMLLNGKGTSVNEEEAFRYYKKAAEKGNVLSMLHYAYLCYRGIGTQVNYEESIRYFRMAAEKGNPEGLFNYGMVLLNGRGIEADIKAACMYFKKAADKGYVKAMTNYGKYIKEEDPKEALHYLKKASEKGDCEATYHYAMLLTSSEDHPDTNEIVRLYETAADGGFPAAMTVYARYLYSRKQSPSDIDECIRYYKMAIEKGEPTAMYYYGKMLQKGDGVEKNIEESLRLYKLAIEKGNMEAQLAYAMMLKEGEGVQADWEEAARLCKIGSDRNHIDSMMTYAEMLESGIGVIPNKSEAMNIYLRAVRLGCDEAVEHYNRLGGQELNLNENQSKCLIS